MHSLHNPDNNVQIHPVARQQAKRSCGCFSESLRERNQPLGVNPRSSREDGLKPSLRRQE